MARYFDGTTFSIIDQFKQNHQNQADLQTKIKAYKAKHHWYNLCKTNEEKMAEQELVNWFNAQFQQSYPGVGNFKIESDEAGRLVYALDDGAMSKIGRMMPAMRIAMQPGIIKNIMIGMMICSAIMTLANPFALGVLVSSLLMMLATSAVMLVAKKIYNDQAKVGYKVHA